MAEMLAQLFYRLMRDNGLTPDQLHAHILECSPDPTTFSLVDAGAEATALSRDFTSIANGEVVV